MSRRRIETLRSFDFSADFQPPQAQPSEPKVSLRPAELAELGARLQAEGAAQAQSRLDTETAARLEATAQRLEHALQDLSALTRQLDRLGREGHLPPKLAQLAALAAQRILDGQGDLFASCQSFSPKS